MKNLILKIIFIFSAFNLIVLPLFTQDTTGINFVTGEWTDILNTAKQQNKYIFVDAFTKWCIPCKMMDKDVYSQSKVGDFYNSKFISYKVDMLSDLGKEFETKYDVYAYPMFLFFSPNGDLVNKSGKYKSADEFIEDGNNSFDPAKNIFALTKRYNENDRSPDFLYNYSIALKNIESPSSPQVIEEYLKTQSDAELFSKKNWEFIREYDWNIHSAGYVFIVKNKQKYIDIYGLDDVTGKIYGTLRANTEGAGRNNKQDEFEDIKAFVRANDISDKEKVLNKLDLEYYKFNGDKTSFINAVNIYTEKYNENDSKKLNEYAWYVYKNSDDKIQLKKALKWIRQSIKLDNAYYNNDTYVWLLYKLGRNDEALKAAENTVSLGQKTGKNVSEIQGLIDKIKKENL